MSIRARLENLYSAMNPRNPFIAGRWHCVRRIVISEDTPDVMTVTDKATGQPVEWNSHVEALHEEWQNALKRLKKRHGTIKLIIGEPYSDGGDTHA